MYIDFCLIPVMVLKNLLQLFNFPVSLFQTEILGQNQMKIHIQAFPGSPGPELMNIHPARFAMPFQDRGNLLQELEIGGVHETGEGMAHQLPAGIENIDTHQRRGSPIQPDFTGQPDQEQTDQNPTGSKHICEDMPAIRHQGDGMGPIADKYQTKTQGQVRPG